MKNKKIAIIPIIILGIFSLAGFAFNEKSGEARNGIRLVLNSPKKTFQLGDIVPVESVVTNNRPVSIYLSGNSESLVTLEIAFKKNSDYKIYVPPVSSSHSFLVDGSDIPTEVRPRETITSSSTILWNYKPETTGLSDHVVTKMNEGRILTNYAFPIAGIYFVKASISVRANGKSKRIESEPIEITIKELDGEDLGVWNKIKDNGEFAYFLQEGEMTRGYKKPEDRDKFRREIEQILIDYPNSSYAEPLRQSLDKFKAAELKRQEFKQKMQKPKPNE